MLMMEANNHGVIEVLFMELRRYGTCASNIERSIVVVLGSANFY